MKKIIALVYSVLLASITFSQSQEECYTQINKGFLRDELKSLTEIYKSVLSDCNSANPKSSKNDCEADLTNIKNNIEQLTALNTLVETLGCNYSIYKDDKPCTSGKYCQAYKIEDKSIGVSTAKSAEEIKVEYDLERKKIKAQNRQQFFELVFKIVGLLLENSNNSGLLGEIKKLINGEENANERYTILNENQSYIDTDGERQGFKVDNPDGSTSFALDTDNDGKPDHLTTYDKTGKVKSEKSLVKKRKKGAAASKVLSTQISNNLSKPPSFNFYSDCVSTLDVKDFAGVEKAWKHRDDEYLYIIGATVKDCGESKWNVVGPTGDISLHVFLNGKSISGRRLFGPYNEGKDELDGSEKYEWLDYCSMRYNNFAIVNIPDNSPSDVFYIEAVEGDDWEALQGADDTIFKGKVSINEIRKGNIAVTGSCDISGKCATLYFAIARYNANSGIFWDNNIASNVPHIPTYYKPFEVGKDIYDAGKDLFTGHPINAAKKIGNTAKDVGSTVKNAVTHPIRTTKKVAEDAYFLSKETVKKIYEGANYVWDGPKKIWGAMNKKWVVISYADGFCIFNHVRGYRTMDEIVNTATGKGGDCDWWAWPEGSNRVCLDGKKNAQKMIKKHGKIKDIKWIDHPTKNCGK